MHIVAWMEHGNIKGRQSPRVSVSWSSKGYLESLNPTVVILGEGETFRR